jgi:hypothetical protein
MKGSEDDLKKLREKREYLQEWLRRYAAADQAAEQVKRQLEVTEWEINAIESSPPDAEEIPPPEFGSTLDSDLASLPVVFPFVPVYDKYQYLSASAFTSGTTVSLFRFASRVGDIGTPATAEYSSRVTSGLREIQERHNRPGLLRELLGSVCSHSTLERLEAAITSYQAFRTGTGSRRGAATDMRTLIDGVKGDLYSRSMRPKHPKERISWPTMASRLAKGGRSTTEYTELVALENTHTSLGARLSDVIHDREAGSLTNLDDIWAEIQEYLVALLGHIQERPREHPPSA